MENKEISRLEQLIQSAKSVQTTSGSTEEWDELLRIIHHGGWTTIAEATLVFNTVESIRTQTLQLNALRTGLLAGARLVGKSQAAGA